MNIEGYAVAFSPRLFDDKASIRVEILGAAIPTCNHQHGFSDDAFILVI